MKKNPNNNPINFNAGNLILKTWNQNHYGVNEGSEAHPIWPSWNSITTTYWLRSSEDIDHNGERTRVNPPKILRRIIAAIQQTQTTQ